MTWSSDDQSLFALFDHQQQIQKDESSLLSVDLLLTIFEKIMCRHLTSGRVTKDAKLPQSWFVYFWFVIDNRILKVVVIPILGCILAIKHTQNLNRPCSDT